MKAHQAEERTQKDGSGQVTTGEVSPTDPRAHFTVQVSQFTYAALRAPAQPGLRLPITRHSSPPTSEGGFTMIEIAISLAIIGFALVAIIGILPTGMNVQKDNRQETIINQDASVFMEALRNGANGDDDLTNYVAAITNYTSQFDARGRFLKNVVYGFTRTNSTVNNSPASQQFTLINGYRIIGLLSTPKFTITPSALVSNHVVAYVQSISGPASEKAPQTNAIMQDLALSYRIICDVMPFGTNNYDLGLLRLPPTNNAAYPERLTSVKYLLNLHTNYHDIRLTFRWPLLPNGDVGSGYQVYRTIVSGGLLATNDHAFLSGYQGVTNFLYFFQPHTYFTAMP